MLVLMQVHKVKELCREEMQEVCQLMLVVHQASLVKEEVRILLNRNKHLERI